MRKTRKQKKAENEPQEQPVESEGTQPEESNETDVERLQRERDEATDSWKRALADYKNLRKRTLVDIDSAVRSSKMGLLSELLLVLDYLDMALQTQCETQEGKNLLFGVDMTRNQMLQFLESQDVKPLESEGAFDPERHQAIENVVTEDAEPGTILETVRKGFTCGEHVLRYAQVKVAAEAAPEEAEAEIVQDEEPSEDTES